MRPRPPSLAREAGFAAIALIIAVATGVNWIGGPLRLVQVLTLVALGVGAGVGIARAVALMRQRR